MVIVLVLMSGAWVPALVTWFSPPGPTDEPTDYYSEVGEPIDWELEAARYYGNLDGLKDMQECNSDPHYC